jgi:hypothetical protein
MAQQAASQQVSRVSIGSIKGMPGASVMVPLTFNADPGKPLRSLIVDIEYVSNSLVFQKATPGIGAELANAKIETTLSELQPDDKGLKHSRLRLTASLPEPPSKDGLPSGVLAYLLFRLAEEAKPFAIRLVPTVSSAEDIGTPPKKVTGIGTEAGQVAVEDPQAIYDRLAPQVACFFFTH